MTAIFHKASIWRRQASCRTQQHQDAAQLCLVHLKRACSTSHAPATPPASQHLACFQNRLASLTCMSHRRTDAHHIVEGDVEPPAAHGHARNGGPPGGIGAHQCDQVYVPQHYPAVKKNVEDTLPGAAPVCFCLRMRAAPVSPAMLQSPMSSALQARPAYQLYGGLSRAWESCL